MQAPTEHGRDNGENVDFDRPSKTGWEFFTKFLFWNIITCVAILLIVGLLTVWS